MPLLADYAITPDVLDIASYASEETCGLYLRDVSKVMRTEGLVRDLRDGEWRRLFATGGRSWHGWGKEMVKKLAAQGRLIRFPPELPLAPSDDRGWCDEALWTGNRQAFTGGIVSTESIKAAYREERCVASVDALERTAWWTRRSESVRLSRTLNAYTDNLRWIMRCANSLQFIDPFLDPTKPRYEHFADLLSVAGQRSPMPAVEIHRMSREDGENLDVQDVERNFRRQWAAPLKAMGLRVYVFVWDRFHDRYLISNLIGISVPHGFDTATNADDRTTWTRLGRNDRDDVQREFDPASRHHRLHGRFSIP